MKKKIFYKVFAATLACVLLMFVFGIIAVNMNTNKIVSERLKEETELAATLMNEQSDFAVFNKYSDNPELRITIFDMNGNVLYESDTKAPLENHADREEIKNALEGKPDTVERYSETFKCDMTYYATKTALSDGTEVILRLAVRSSQVTPYFTAIIPLFILVLAVSLVLSFVLSTFISRNVSSKVTEIGESLKSLNEGQYAPIKTDMSEPELFGVLNQINELNANIHSHIRVADGERVKLNAVLDNVSQSIIALDRSKRIVFANKRAFEMFNGTHHDIGRDLVFLIEKLPVYEQITTHIGENFAFNCAYDDKYLSVVITKVTNEVICDDISAIIIVTDITKEKLIEKQKSDFFANASHELKTPITVMQGFAEVLMNKEGMDDTSKKQLGRIYKECLRLGSLISDMLMLSKIESGDAAVRALSEVALEDIAKEVLDGLSEKAQSRNITVKIVGCGKICADQTMIFELVENLVSNAIKYNKDGGSVTVSITETDTGVCLKVEDTGIGIEKEHLPRLCERFYRVDKSHSKRIGGTGLGLAIVKHICAISDAELSIESEFGVGTTVTVVFGK
ncbi:MAG: PAS domain-containing protein [Clostridia bacterium]|nr:PAS domain-containing protein [Clostridia bacterium]MBO5091998.1 PAS domain-containing protein [Clostridia bacterium]